MKKYLIFLLFVLVGVLILEFWVIYSVKHQSLLLKRAALERKSKIALLVTQRREAQILATKIIVLKKTHALDLASLKESALESLFYAAQLARLHHLTLLKSDVNEDRSIKMILSGRLEDFSDFIQAFSRSQKNIQLLSISINARPSLSFEIDWLHSTSFVE